MEKSSFYACCLVFVLLVGCTQQKQIEAPVHKGEINLGDNQFSSLGNLIKIGNQNWTIKNLDVNTYLNGDTIPYVSDSLLWIKLKSGAWCYYRNESENGAVYGKLYNWYAVNDPRGIAPKGFHLPTSDEWVSLNNYLGPNAAGMLKNNSQWINSNDGTNRSGFNALPSGVRYSNGQFALMGTNCYFWSSTIGKTTIFAKSFSLKSWKEETVGIGFEDKEAGFSIRLIKD